MASDPAVELARCLRSRIWCRECLGAVPAVDTCEACGGTGCTRESLAAIRAALDAAGAEERAACVDLCRARGDNLTGERFKISWHDDRWPELWARAEEAYDCAAALRGRRA